MKVRPFSPDDRSALREVFERAGAGSPTESMWDHSEAEADVYLYPYMDLEPQSLFVAEDGDALVGYLTGCVDGSAFPAESTRMEQAIRRHRLLLRRHSAAFFVRGLWDMGKAMVRSETTSGEFDDPRWPAHLHINVAPQARGTGAANELMTQWLDRLRALDSPGCHLQTLVENHRAAAFFGKFGFVAHGPTPAVPGLRYHGEQMHQQTMVLSM